MINYDDFFKLPVEVQRGFISQFRQVIDVAVDCGDHYDIFGESMTCLQFKTIFEIVKRYDIKNGSRYN